MLAPIKTYASQRQGRICVQLAVGFRIALEIWKVHFLILGYSVDIDVLYST
jgi:hypothetical protein